MRLAALLIALAIVTAVGATVVGPTFISMGSAADQVRSAITIHTETATVTNEAQVDPTGFTTAGANVKNNFANGVTTAQTSGLLLAEFISIQNGTIATPGVVSGATWTWTDNFANSETDTLSPLTTYSSINANETAPNNANVVIYVYWAIVSFPSTVINQGYVQWTNTAASAAGCQAEYYAIAYNTAITKPRFSVTSAIVPGGGDGINIGAATYSSTGIAYGAIIPAQQLPAPTSAAGQTNIGAFYLSSNPNVPFYSKLDTLPMASDGSAHFGWTSPGFSGDYMYAALAVAADSPSPPPSGQPGGSGPAALPFQSPGQPPVVQVTYTLCDIVNVTDVRQAALSAILWFWDWGDGNQTITQEPSASHVYARAGTYTVEVKVQDISGRVDTFVGAVTVGGLSCTILPFAYALGPYILAIAIVLVVTLLLQLAFGRVNKFTYGAIVAIVILSAFIGVFVYYGWAPTLPNLFNFALRRP